jgi:multidrug efflux pump subunit AcrB
MQEEYTHKSQMWYREKLIAFLQNRRSQRILLWSLFAGLILAFALPVTGLLKVIFFPGEDVDYVFVEIETKQGTPLLQTDLVVRTVEEVLYEKEYVEAFSTTAGSGSSFTGSTNAGGKFANITVTLDKERTQSSDEISDDLRDSLAFIKDAKITIAELENGPPTGAPVFIKFLGDDLDALLLASDNVERLLGSIEGTRDITASTKSNATEFVLTLDKAKASALGVSQATIGEVLRTAVFGVTAR